MAQKKEETEREKQRESGMPGGGAGRKDQVGGSGVYPMSGPHPPGDAPIVAPGSWGQGARGGAGYQDHGESEIIASNVKPEKCRDLMTKDPVCCLPEESASDAADRMRRYKVGVLPVVADQQGKALQGLITDRDLAMRVVAEGRDPGKTKVGEIMSRDVVSCSPDDPCDRAVELMQEHRIRRIPAKDNSGRVVGIISQADVSLRVHDNEKTAELVGAISQP